ncbi:hypothetical protein RRG08_064528 [Elysia crispata]|uniref:PiggyBac transposable element-derived protein domain-containing protein n=1 Tax=Elysia crispata TaxID=231223 RepID=A0AAE1CPY2_9GAST|nr:hypothetical protein RRG08_064528 [Elysia crispata]
MDLLAPYRQTNIRVSMDNFYTGVPLLRRLHSEGICAVGTIRTNRKHLPKELLPKIAPLAKHNYKVAQAGELTFSVWMDTKAVCVLSTHHCSGQTGTVTRRSGHVEQQRVVVPATLADYQQNMKGVDLCDQLLGYYMPGHS